MGARPFFISSHASLASRFATSNFVCLARCSAVPADPELLKSSPNLLAFDPFRATTALPGFDKPPTAFFPASRFFRPSLLHRRSAASCLASASALCHHSHSSSCHQTCACVAGMSPAGSAQESQTGSSNRSRTPFAVLRHSTIRGLAMYWGSPIARSCYRLI